MSFLLVLFTNAGERKNFHFLSFLILENSHVRLARAFLFGEQKARWDKTRRNGTEQNSTLISKSTTDRWYGWARKERKAGRSTNHTTIKFVLGSATCRCFSTNQTPTWLTTTTTNTHTNSDSDIGIGPFPTDTVSSHSAGAVCHCHCFTRWVALSKPSPRGLGVCFVTNKGHVFMAAIRLTSQELAFTRSVLLSGPRRLQRIGLVEAYACRRRHCRRLVQTPQRCVSSHQKRFGTYYSALVTWHKTKRTWNGHLPSDYFIHVVDSKRWMTRHLVWRT